jgi:hypothetical protein
MNNNKIILSVFAFFAVVMLGAVFVNLLTLDLAQCANEEVDRTVGPEGERHAVLFERNCGATTPYTTHLSVLPVGATLPDEPGNILSVQGRADENIRAVRWTTAERLEVEILTTELINEPSRRRGLPEVRLVRPAPD